MSLYPLRSVRSHAGVVALFSLLATTVAFAASTNAAPGDPAVTGSFFVDFDRDGQIDVGEQVADTDPLFPPSGISVTATDADGTTVNGVVTPGTPPTWTVDSSALNGSTFRIEFALDPADVTAGWSETFSGTDSVASVLFADAGDSVTFGVVPPSQCPDPDTTDGTLWTTCFVNGDRSAGGPDEVLVEFAADGSGSSSYISSKNELGSIFGLAYDEWESRLFTSAYVKRHVELGDADGDGDNDAAGLFWFNFPNETPNGIDLETLGGPTFGDFTAARDADTVGFADPSADPEAFDAVSKMGVGGIDVSDDGRILYVMNLFSKAVMAYDISDIDGVGMSLIGSYTIADGSVACPNVSGSASASDWWPFAVEVTHDGQLLVGVSCTAETSGDQADLEAGVLTLSTGADRVPDAVTSKFGFSLDYFRGCAYVNTGCTDGSFLPWASEWDDLRAPFVIDNRQRYNHPSAVVTAIAIDDDGGLAVTLLDRGGDQVGYENYNTDGNNGPGFPTLSPPQYDAAGDLIRLCNTSNDPLAPTYVVEGGVGCETTNFVDATGGDIETQDDLGYVSGPAGDVEWYGDDSFTSRNDDTEHVETTIGGNWIHPYLGSVITAQYDPVLEVNSGGLAWFDTLTGEEETAVELYVGGPTAGTFGKSNGIGDVEGCAIPLEIGDYVWLDLDRDGIQDPGETALAGVTLTITGPGLPAAGVSTITDANGLYRFGSVDGLQPNSDYSIAVDVSTVTTTLPGGFSAADLTETITGAGSTTTDSNVSGGVIAASTGAVGANDHSFDAGFTVPKTFDLALAKTVSASTPGPVAEGDEVTFDITITNQRDEVMSFDIVDYVNLAMFEPFSNLNNSDITVTSTNGIDLDVVYSTSGTNGLVSASVKEPTESFDTGDSVTIPVTLTIADGFVGPQAINWAEISAFDDDLDPTNPPPTDVDSTPNTDQGDDNQPSGPGEPGDDEINGTGTGTDPVAGDEDDHDVAAVGVRDNRVWDLALVKQLAAGQTFSLSDADAPIQWSITVTNQGTEPAYRVQVTDVLDTNVSFESFDGVTAGTAVVTTSAVDGATGTVTFDVDELAPGETVSFAISTTIETLSSSGEFFNTAEISGFDDDTDATNTVPSNVVDIDSTPDADPNNDTILTTPGTDPNGNDDRNSHNNVNFDHDGDGNLNEVSGVDEDDHDRELVTISYDLALEKTVPDGTSPVTPGQDVTFGITVTNQGAGVRSFEVTDSVDNNVFEPFAIADNPVAAITSANGVELAVSYAASGGNGVITVSVVNDGELFATGDTATVSVVLTLVDPIPDLDIANVAEITSFDNDDDPDNPGPDDTDSTPGSGPDDDDDDWDRVTLEVEEGSSSTTGLAFTGIEPGSSLALGVAAILVGLLLAGAGRVSRAGNRDSFLA